MKRILAILVVLLMTIGMVFAASSVNGNDTGGEIPGKDSPAKAEIEFNLDVSGGAGSQSKWEIGFSSTAVTADASSIPTAVANTINFNLDTNALVGTYGGENSLYAYWSILSGSPAFVKLYMEDALEGTEPAEGEKNKLDWKFQVNGGQFITEYGGEDGAYAQILDFDPSTGIGAKGSCTVTVQTASLSTVKPDTYSGNLVLAISAK